MTDSYEAWERQQAHNAAILAKAAAKFVPKEQRGVYAVQIGAETAPDLETIANWCGGQIRTDIHRPWIRFIRLRNGDAAYPGDFIVQQASEGGAIEHNRWSANDFSKSWQEAKQ